MEKNTTHELLVLIERETGKTASLDTKIRDLGIDSLDFLSLIVEVQSQFKMTISDRQIAQIQTIGDLLNIIHAHIPA